MICKKDIAFLHRSVSEFVKGFKQYRPQILESQVRDYIAYFFDCDDFEELEEYVLKKENIEIIKNSLNLKKKLIDNFKKRSDEFSILELETIINDVNFTQFTWFKFSIKNTDKEISQFTSQNQMNLVSVNKNFLIEIKLNGTTYCGFIGRILSHDFFKEQSSLLYFAQKGHVSYGKILINENKQLHATAYVALFFEKDILSRSHYEQLLTVFESSVDYQIQTQINLLKHWFPNQKKSLLSKSYLDTQLYSIKINPYGKNTETVLFKQLNNAFEKLDLMDNMSVVLHHSLKIVNDVDVKVIRLTEDTQIQTTYNVSISSNSYNQIILKRYLEILASGFSLTLIKEKDQSFTDRLFKNTLAQKKIGVYDLIQEQIHQSFTKLISKSINVDKEYTATIAQNKFKESIHLPFEKQKDNYLIVGSTVFAYDMLKQLGLSIKMINFKKYYNVLLSKDAYLSYADKAKLMKENLLEKVHIENKTVTKHFLFEYLNYLNFQFKLRLDIDALSKEFERITFDNQLLFIEYLDLIEMIQATSKKSSITYHSVMFTENYMMNVTDSKLFNSLIFLFIMIHILNDNSTNIWVLNNIQEYELINYVELLDMFFRYRSGIYNKSSICFIYDKLSYAIAHNVYSHLFKMLIGEKQVLDEDNYSTHFIVNKVVQPSKHLMEDETYHNMLYIDNDRADYYYVLKNQ